jgi:hypothetical protein
MTRRGATIDSTCRIRRQRTAGAPPAQRSRRSIERGPQRGPPCGERGILGRGQGVDPGADARDLDRLAATARVLDARPDAVLCNSVVRYVRGDRSTIGYYDSGLSHADDPSPAKRFAAMVLPSHSCVDFFGLLRREAITDSLLHGSYHSADRAFLAQLALRGRLVQLREPLAVMREHGERYTRRKGTPTEILEWHDASRRSHIALPTWRLYADYISMVNHERLSIGARLSCYAVLAEWWARNWNSARAAVDLISIVLPGAQQLAWRVKTRLFGAAPGHFL